MSKKREKQQQLLLRYLPIKTVISLLLHQVNDD